MPPAAMPPATTLTVRLTPRAGRDAIQGWDGDTLRVRVAAPPVEGQANAALIRLLARALRLPSRDIAIMQGARGRDKVVQVQGLTTAEVRARLSVA